MGTVGFILPDRFSAIWGRWPRTDRDERACGSVGTFVTVAQDGRSQCTSRSYGHPVHLCCPVFALIVSIDAQPASKRDYVAMSDCRHETQLNPLFHDWPVALCLCVVKLAEHVDLMYRRTHRNVEILQCTAHGTVDRVQLHRHVSPPPSPRI